MLLPLIYTNIVYALIFWLSFLTWCILEFLGPARWRGSGGTKKQDGGSFIALNLLVCVGAGLYFFLPFCLPGATITWPQPLLFFAGLALMFLGMGWRWYAIRTLGRYFTGVVMIHADQRVVQHGPYRLIRHPSYSGATLATLGVGLMMTNWASLLALMLGLLSGLVYRISVEEQALRAALGQPYEEYMQRTKRLVPFIY